MPNVWKTGLNSDRLSWRIGLVLIALIAAALAQLPAIVKVRVAEYDEAVYLDIARSIQRTGVPLRSLGEQGQYDVHTPLYLYLLSLYAGSSTTEILVARLVTALFGLGCVLLVFGVGERIGGTFAGFVAAVLLAVNPFFALHSFFVRMEVPMIFMLLLGLCALLEGKNRDQPVFFLLAGGSFAAAVLLREFAFLFGLCCSGYVLLVYRRGRGLLYSVMVGLPTVLALVAWLVWLWSVSPVQFQALVHRWVDSAAGSGIADPRSLVSEGLWAQQIIQDLFNAAVSLTLALAVLYVLFKTRWDIRNERFFFIGYLAIAIGISFLVRLKELRHIIETVPIATLVIATSVNWETVGEWGWRHWLRKSLGGLGAALFLFLASPLRLPLKGVTNLRSWFDPVYAQRVFGNDPHYNVLRLAGLYIQKQTRSDEMITITHEAPIVAYYADRRYNMLYTAPADAVAGILERTRYLVWDSTLFLALGDDQVRAVQDYVAQNFIPQQVVQDKYRKVIIYRRNGF